MDSKSVETMIEEIHNIREARFDSVQTELTILRS